MTALRRALGECGTLPVLELDDGTCIAESIAICRYFEELHPNPPLLLDYGIRFAGLAIPAELENLRAWYSSMAARPHRAGVLAMTFVGASCQYG